MTDHDLPGMWESADLEGGEADTAAEFKPPKCGGCGRERTARDAYDYNPLQVITGQPVGWYSGDDGELCPQCMASALSGQRIGGDGS